MTSVESPIRDTNPSDRGGPSSSNSSNVIDLTVPETVPPVYPTMLPSQSIEYVVVDSDEDDDEEVRFIRQTQPQPRTRRNSLSSFHLEWENPWTPPSYPSLFEYMRSDNDRRHGPAGRRIFHPLSFQDFESSMDPLLRQLEMGNGRANEGAQGSNSTPATAATVDNFEEPFIHAMAMERVQGLLQRVDQAVTGMFGVRTPTRRAPRRTDRQNAVRRRLSAARALAAMGGGDVGGVGGAGGALASRLPRTLHNHNHNHFEEQFLAWAGRDRGAADETRRRADADAPASRLKRKAEVAPGYTRSVYAHTRLACPRCSVEFGTAEMNGGETKLWVIMGCGHVICDDCVEPLFTRRVPVKVVKPRKAPTTRHRAKGKGRESPRIVPVPADTIASLGDEAKADEAKTDESQTDETKTDEARADVSKTDDSNPGVAEDAQEKSDYGSALMLAPVPATIAEQPLTDTNDTEKFKMLPKVTSHCPACNRQIRKRALQQIYL
ncbi:hypothetical protein BGZ94_009136 [Podila epigama]|nr:hypothetical protein BGZ94_009136 [Podila epigama]